ncbi:hypothetical protein ES705_45647 [subsurface metagenome]
MKAIQKSKKIAIELKDRWQAETPKHFKRMRTGGAIVAGVGLTIKILAAIFPPTMPAGLVALAPELIGIGLAIAGVSQTARGDTNTKSKPRKGLRGIIQKILP